MNSSAFCLLFADAMFASLRRDKHLVHLLLIHSSSQRGEQDHLLLQREILSRDTEHTPGAVVQEFTAHHQ